MQSCTDQFWIPRVIRRTHVLFSFEDAKSIDSHGYLIGTDFIIHMYLHDQLAPESIQVAFDQAMTLNSQNCFASAILIEFLLNKCPKHLTTKQIQLAFDRATTPKYQNPILGNCLVCPHIAKILFEKYFDRLSKPQIESVFQWAHDATVPISDKNFSDYVIATVLVFKINETEILKPSCTEVFFSHMEKIKHSKSKQEILDLAFEKFSKCVQSQWIALKLVKSYVNKTDQNKYLHRLFCDCQKLNNKALAIEISNSIHDPYDKHRGSF